MEVVMTDGNFFTELKRRILGGTKKTSLEEEETQEAERSLCEALLEVNENGVIFDDEEEERFG